MDKSIEFASSNLQKESETSVKEKIFRLLNKKNLKIILLLAIGIVAMLLFFGMGSSNKTSDNPKENSAIGYISTMDYCNMLENKLTDVLSQVDGAGDVRVMITVDGSPELIYANEQDKTSSSSTSGNSTTSTYSSPIIVNVNGSSSALVMTEVLPAVKGVIVVSSGAGNVSTKLNILKAVSTLLDISTEQITVLKGV